jgi:hypothetical protein
MVMGIHTATPTDDVWQPAAADPSVNNPLTLAGTPTTPCETAFARTEYSNNYRHNTAPVNARQREAVVVAVVVFLRPTHPQHAGVD